MRVPRGEVPLLFWRVDPPSDNKHMIISFLKRYKKHKNIVFVTVAGMSNALSGVVASNTNVPVIACPPFKDNTDMMININSSLM